MGNKTKLNEASADIADMSIEGVSEEITALVDKFLNKLRIDMRGKPTQYDRMLEVLGAYLLSPAPRTSSEVASSLGISDSLVSEYRRRIDQVLYRLSDMVELKDAREFDIALQERVRALVGHERASYGETYDVILLDSSGRLVAAPSSGVLRQLGPKTGDIVALTIPSAEFERLSFKTKEVLAETSLAQKRIAKDREEIDLLKEETRNLLNQLRAA